MSQRPMPKPLPRKPLPADRSIQQRPPSTFTTKKPADELQRRSLQDYAIQNYPNQQFSIGVNDQMDYGQIGRNPNIPIPQFPPTDNFGDTARELQVKGKLPWKQGQVGQRNPFLQATDADQAAFAYGRTAIGLGAMTGLDPTQIQQNQITEELKKRFAEQQLSMSRQSIPLGMQRNY